jgi:hypothetical protein
MPSASYLRRVFKQFISTGCDISKMHECFGYKNTDKHPLRTICLERDQEFRTKMKLTITCVSKDYDILDTHINGLPKEMNYIVNSYLSTNRVLVYAMELPQDYPFQTVKWTLLSYTEDGLERPFVGPDPNELYCGNDSTPSMLFDSDILMYVSSLRWFNE